MPSDCSPRSPPTHAPTYPLTHPPTTGAPTAAFCTCLSPLSGTLYLALAIKARNSDGSCMLSSRLSASLLPCPSPHTTLDCLQVCHASCPAHVAPATHLLCLLLCFARPLSLSAAHPLPPIFAQRPIPIPQPIPQPPSPIQPPSHPLQQPSPAAGQRSPNIHLTTGPLPSYHLMQVSCCAFCTA